MVDDGRLVVMETLAQEPLLGGGGVGEYRVQYRQGLIVLEVRVCVGEWRAHLLNRVSTEHVQQSGESDFGRLLQEKKPGSGLAVRR